MITKLTEEQEKRLVDVRSEWLSIGYSTAPLNRPEATKIIGEFYQRIGKQPPAVLFFSSPAMCILAWALLKNFSTDKVRSQLGSQLRSQLGSQLRSQLWSQLESQLRSQLGSQLRSQLESQLWSQLRSQLESQLGSQLGSQLESQLWSQLGSQLESQLSNVFCGHHWCAWEVLYKFAEEIGVKYGEKNSELLDLWLHQSRHLHWWFPYKGIALVSERYTTCEVDRDARLHSPSGPAVGYSDGWGIWAWHGVRVDQRVIEQPEKISAKEILAEENAEIRRVMMERVGMERFISEAGASQIHTCPAWDPIEHGISSETSRAFIGNQNFKFKRGTWDLFSINLPGDPERFLRAVRVKDPSTGRIYFLRVPPTIDRADDAVAWTFGFDTAKQYRPIAET